LQPCPPKICHCLFKTPKIRSITLRKEEWRKLKSSFEFSGL
jgi:hypothetical protein